MISAKDLINLFQQALKDKWGYIWGTAGERWTALKQTNLEKTTDPDRALGRAYGSKWIGHKVADCSGLFSWSFHQLGGTMYHGSHTMFLKWCSAKGELKNGKRTDFAALKPGTAVFVWDGRKYTHVGLYVGGDTVIEAQGTKAGVTTSKVTASKWTHWGELTGVVYDAGQCTMNNEQCIMMDTDAFDSACQPQSQQCHSEHSEESPSSPCPSEPRECHSERSEESSPPLLRRGSKGESVRDVQRLLQGKGYDLGPCGVDGDFGSATEKAVRQFQADHGLAADGIVGPETRAALEAPGTNRYTVTIPHLTKFKAEAFLKDYAGASMREEESGFAVSS